MIDPREVSAVLVTRGDQDLQEIYDSIEQAGITDVVTWDNSKRRDVSCYGRYLGIDEAENEFIYHQDDDLVAPVGEILGRWDARDRFSILANNRIDEEWPLTAMGVVFHRELSECFDPYLDLYGEDDDFYRVCDVVFAYQHPYRRIAVGYRDLPWGTSPTASMYFEPDHMRVRKRARERTLALPQQVIA